MAIAQNGPDLTGPIETGNSIQLEGGRHAILLLHGLGGTAQEVKLVAKRLNRQGFTVRIPSLPGHNGNCEQLASIRWQDWYQSAQWHFEQLALSYDQVSVSGLCMGSVLALQLASRKGARVASVVAMSTTLAYDGSSMPWYQFLLPLVLHTPLQHFWRYQEGGNLGIKNPVLRRHLASRMGPQSSVAYDRMPAASIREMMKLMRSTRKRLGNVLAPTLIMHAEEDDVASPRNADYLERHLGSSHIEKIILDDCYHLITLDQQRELVAAEAGRFMLQQQHLRQSIRTPARAVLEPCKTADLIVAA